MEDLMLSARDVGLTIEGKQILRRIRLDVRAGEFIGIIGPNGAGKSTLLKSLRGIRRASGEIELFGRRLREMPEKEIARNVAYMQQEINTGFGLTARQIVLAGRYPYLAWWRHEGKEDYEIAAKYMEFTGVRHLADADISRMSGGEKQRVLLAKVLTQETDLIFLDEPTASLDLTYQEEIFRRCREICALGKSILVVVHDIRLAAKFCSRLVLMDKGKILADGFPPEVITEKNLKEAYQMNAAVFKNYISGFLDLYTYEKAKNRRLERRVHVIGGGGTAAAVLRALYERRCRITAGVLSSGDADFLAAAAFLVEVADKKPFSPPAESARRKNAAFISSADVTVLCSIFFGAQNLDNLKDAFLAKRLVVLEDAPVEARDFTGGEAAGLYRELTSRPQAFLMTTREFLDVLEAGEEGGGFGAIFDQDAATQLDGPVQLGL